MEKIIELKKVNKWFGKYQVLKDINLSVSTKEKIVICGPSGSGKSTLIRCINRLEARQKGQIIVDGTELTEETKNIEQTLLDLSTKHMNADLIIWPESPFPYLNSSPQMKALLSKINNFPIILSGSWEYNNNKLFNALTLLGTNQSYYKRHLVPFGEYMPFKNLLSKLPFLKIVTGDIGFESGEEVKTINTSLGNARIAICYEIIFPEEINPNKSRAPKVIHHFRDNIEASSEEE